MEKLGKKYFLFTKQFTPITRGKIQQDITPEDNGQIKREQ